MSGGLRCSFCGKGDRAIVVFLRNDVPGLCDACVDAAARIVADQRAKLAGAKCLCGDDYDQEGNRFWDSSICPIHGPSP